MAKLNKRGTDNRFNTDTQLAGGFGGYAANQDVEGLLRRAVMANLLWENNFYQDGEHIADTIANLVPQVDGATVATIAWEARHYQKLRHVPLLLAREMARYDTHKGYLAELLPSIIRRPDEMTELLAIYWKNGRIPIAAQMKKGLATSFQNFDRYQLAKYKQDDKEIKLVDVLRLVHPKPVNQEQAQLWYDLRHDELGTADTWEAAFSAGDDKRETWERLIGERRLGGFAFLRNLRNMESVGVSHETIKYGFQTVNSRWLLPLNYLAAAKQAPRWERYLEDMMLRGFENTPKLAGYTIFVVDTSGSMSNSVSAKSQMTRLDAAMAMAMLANEVCEEVSVYATAGNDGARRHATTFVPNRRGFGMISAIKDVMGKIGGGGIFTRQALEYIAEQEGGRHVDRIIIFSDSQDCDYPAKRTPDPFGSKNYIIDVSAHTNGINYRGVWDAEISGWSEHFLTWIMANEGLTVEQVSE